VGHGALARADRIVVVSTGAPDAVAATGRTFDRLRGIGAASAAEAVVAVTGVRGQKLKQTWPAERVVAIPWDAGFHGAEPVDVGRLHRATRAALLQLAAAVSAEYHGGQ
jgi:hypothetical protein